MRKIYIFGAHARGWILAEYLKTLYPQTELKGLLVNNNEEKPTQNSVNMRIFGTMSCSLRIIKIDVEDIMQKTRAEID